MTENARLEETCPHISCRQRRVFNPATKCLFEPNGPTVREEDDGKLESCMHVSCKQQRSRDSIARCMFEICSLIERQSNNAAAPSCDVNLEESNVRPSVPLQQPLSACRRAESNDTGQSSAALQWTDFADTLCVHPICTRHRMRTNHSYAKCLMERSQGDEDVLRTETGECSHVSCKLRRFSSPATRCLFDSNTETAVGTLAPNESESNREQDLPFERAQTPPTPPRERSRSSPNVPYAVEHSDNEERDRRSGIDIILGTPPEDAGQMLVYEICTHPICRRRRRSNPDLRCTLEYLDVGHYSETCSHVTCRQRRATNPDAGCTFEHGNLVRREEQSSFHSRERCAHPVCVRHRRINPYASCLLEHPEVNLEIPGVDIRCSHALCEQGRMQDPTARCAFERTERVRAEETSSSDICLHLSCAQRRLRNPWTECLFERAVLSVHRLEDLPPSYAASVNDATRRNVTHSEEAPPPTYEEALFNIAQSSAVLGWS